MFDAKIDPTDIIQGNLGNCYFLSALSALAEYSNRVQDIFLTKEINDSGIYAVSIFLNGERRTVVVDD